MPPERSQRIRVLLAEDHEVVRSGLRLILEKQPDMQVVGEVGRGDEVLPAVAKFRPDVVVLDIRLPGLDGTQVAEQLARHHPDVRIVALTAHPDAALLHLLLRAGAAGYVLKLSPAAELCQAIRAVMAGRVHIDARMRRYVAAPPEEQADPASPGGALSDREREVLRLIALGYTHAEIARRIGVSVKTVETYRSRIADKLGLRTRAEMVRFALSRGLLEEVGGPR